MTSPGEECPLLRMNAPTLAGLCAALALSVSLGCSGGGGPDSPTGTRASAPALPSPTSTTAAAKAEALDAYRGMWQDMVVAARTSDYQSPLLARHATGSALRQLVDSLYAAQQQGVVTKGQPVLHPRVGESDLNARPARVVVEDCGDSRNWLQYKKSGEPANDQPGGNRHISADVRLVNGSWKVFDFRVREIGSC
jgi:hypothetical protein